MTHAKRMFFAPRPFARCLAQRRKDAKNKKLLRTPLPDVSHKGTKIRKKLRAPFARCLAQSRKVAKKAPRPFTQCLAQRRKDAKNKKLLRTLLPDVSHKGTKVRRKLRTPLPSVSRKDAKAQRIRTCSAPFCPTFRAEMRKNIIFIFVFYLFLSSCWGMQEDKKSRVVVLEDPSLVSRFQVDSDRAADAFNRALLKFTGQTSVAEAWKTLVKPTDAVGIRITAPGNPILATNRKVLKAVIDGLKSAGVKPNKIIVWDKFEDLMIASGYVPNESQKDWQLRSVIPGSGFDGEKFYFNEIVGKLIWGDYEFVGSKKISAANIAKASLEEEKEKEEIPDQISNRSFFAKIVTQDVQKIINLAILSDHPTVGIYGACSSLSMACVDNNRRFLDPRIAGEPAIGEILNHDALKGKVVLHVMTGFIAQFAGGPSFNPHYTQPAGILMMSQDPAAIDSLALERLEEWREEKVVPPIGSAARHVKDAARLGVGTDDREKMLILPLLPQ